MGLNLLGPLSDFYVPGFSPLVSKLTKLLVFQVEPIGLRDKRDRDFVKTFS